MSGPPIDEGVRRQLAALGQSVKLVDVEAGGWAELEGCWAHVLGGAEVVSSVTVGALPDSVELVCFLGTGFESQLDVRALEARHVVACYTPYANVRATAEFALCLLIAGLRGIATGVEQVRRCEWSPPQGRSLKDCEVGVVGFGHVGRELLAMLSVAFEVAPLVWNRTRQDDAIRRAGGRPADLESIFASCDAISLHADQPEGEPPLVDAKLLGSVRPELVLVNTARGRLIDPHALRAALERDVTMRVLADVYPREPVCPRVDPFGLLALGAERFLLTPHMAYASRESAEQAGAMLLANVEAYLAGRPVPHRACPASFRGTTNGR